MRSISYSGSFPMASAQPRLHAGPVSPAQTVRDWHGGRVPTSRGACLRAPASFGTGPRRRRERQAAHVRGTEFRRASPIVSESLRGSSTRSPTRTCSGCTSEMIQRRFRRLPFGQPGETVPVVDGVCHSFPPAHVLRFPVGVTETDASRTAARRRASVSHPGGRRRSRPGRPRHLSHPLRVRQRRIEVEGRQAANEIGQQPTGSRGDLGCVPRLNLTARNKPLRMYREPLANDDVGQGHRTGKALPGEQSLRHNATVRPTRFIGATRGKRSRLTNRARLSLKTRS